MPRSKRPDASRRMRRVNARHLTAAAATLAGAALAGCAASGSSPQSPATAKQQSAEQRNETTFADFAKCLREHGIDAEAISHPGGGHGLRTTGGSPAAMTSAEKACARYRPEEQKGSPSAQQKVEVEETARRFAKCMREHGIDVEAGSSGGITIHAAGNAGGAAPDLQGPAMKKARAACQKLLPDGGP